MGSMEGSILFYLLIAIIIAVCLLVVKRALSFHRRPMRNHNLPARVDGTRPLTPEVVPPTFPVVRHYPSPADSLLQGIPYSPGIRGRVQMRKFIKFAGLVEQYVKHLVNIKESEKRIHELNRDIDDIRMGKKQETDSTQPRQEIEPPRSSSPPPPPPDSVFVGEVPNEFSRKK
jgi:hypothetical protein